MDALTGAVLAEHSMHLTYGAVLHYGEKKGNLYDQLFCIICSRGQICLQLVTEFTVNGFKSDILHLDYPKLYMSNKIVQKHP